MRSVCEYVNNCVGATHTHSFISLCSFTLGAEILGILAEVCWQQQKLWPLQHREQLFFDGLIKEKYLHQRFEIHLGEQRHTLRANKLIRLLMSFVISIPFLVWKLLSQQVPYQMTKLFLQMHALSIFQETPQKLVKQFSLEKWHQRQLQQDFCRLIDLLMEWQSRKNAERESVLIHCKWVYLMRQEFVVRSNPH